MAREKSKAALDSPPQKIREASPLLPGSGIPLTGVNARSVITRHVLDEIRKRNWRVGGKISTEVELAHQLGVSKSMVNQALKSMEKEGVLVRYRRRGTFIAKLPIAQMEHSTDCLSMQADRVHVLTPIEPNRISMHWNSAALHQLETVLNAAGLRVEHASIANCPDPAELRDRVKQLANEESHGLIILGNLVSVPRDQSVTKALIPLVIELMNYSGTVVWLNRAGLPLDAWPFDAISFSPLNQGVMVGQHIMKHAVKRVICIKIKDVRWAEMRVTGVQVGLDSHPGQPPMIAHQLITEPGIDGCWDKVIHDIIKQKDRPTVVTPNDLYAVSLIDESRKHGLSCPKDFCIMSFDNYDACRHYNITTVAPTVNHLGEAIGMLITDQIRHPAHSTIHLTLDSTLVERSSFFYPSSQ